MNYSKVRCNCVFYSARQKHSLEIHGELFSRRCFQKYYLSMHLLILPGSVLLAKTVSSAMIVLLLIGMFTLLFGIESVESQPKTWIVDDDVPADFQKIQDGINAASAGDTVFVRAGTYYENVVVNKTISLSGENRETTVVDGNGNERVVSIQAQNVSVASMTVTNASTGIYIGNSNSTVNNLKVFGTYVGIWAYESAHCVINDSLIMNQTIHHGEWEDFGGIGILLESCGFFDITWNIFENIEGGGIAILGGYVIVKNNTFSGTSVGIGLEALSCTVVQNLIENASLGIYLSSSSDNAISGNSVSNSEHGVLLDVSSNNTISENNLTNNSDGVHLYFSSNNTIIKNNATNNGNGIYLDNSLDNTISENNVAGNKIDSYHGVWLVDSSRNTISGNNATNIIWGIWLGRSSHNIVDGNSVTNTEDSIVLVDSSNNNTVSRNDVTATNWDGIWLHSSSSNTISGNKIGNNNRGIWFDNSSSNTISGNNVTANNDGIVLYGSSNNEIRYNNFLNNQNQVYSHNSTNLWDDGYPSGGNYWSNYNGTDSYFGPGQNETGSDGINDQPYVIDESNMDRYPLMHPYTAIRGDTNQDGIVDIYDAILLATAFSSTPHDPDWNPHADFNSDGLIDIFDAIILAGNFGKTT